MGNFNNYNGANSSIITKTFFGSCAATEENLSKVRHPDAVFEVLHVKVHKWLQENHAELLSLQVSNSPITGNRGESIGTQCFLTAMAKVTENVEEVTN